jgi:hypothetical protein
MNCATPMTMEYAIPMTWETVAATNKGLPPGSRCVLAQYNDGVHKITLPKYYAPEQINSDDFFTMLRADVDEVTRTAILLLDTVGLQYPWGLKK